MNFIFNFFWMERVRPAAQPNKNKFNEFILIWVKQSWGNKQIQSTIHLFKEKNEFVWFEFDGRSSWRHQQIKLMKLIFFVGLACRFRHTAGQPNQTINEIQWRWIEFHVVWLVTAPCLRKLHSILKIQL